MHTPPGTLSPRTSEGARSDPDGLAAQRSEELSRIKFVATGLLILTAAIAIAAKLLEDRHWSMGYVAAWATAATVGGLADWYAVVALFRRPWGVPLPHTAIIPRNQRRIAEGFGSFIEEQFLAPEPIAQKLRTVDFAGLASDWLAHEGRSAALSRFVLRLLPQALVAVEETGLRSFLAKRAVERLEAIKFAPFAGNLLGALVEDDRHQRVFDEILVGLNRLLGSQSTLDAVQEKIRGEIPSLFNLFRADAYLVRRFVTLVSGFIEEARRDPAHPLRCEFDQFIKTFIEKLKSSPEYADKAEALKRELLGRPEITDLADEIWQSVKSFLQRDGHGDDSDLLVNLSRFLTDIGRTLSNEKQLRADINVGMVVILQTFIQNQKSSISLFISNQIKSWDMKQMVDIIELNIGQDLQYIRLNGTIIGGLFGFLLYAGEKLLYLG
jgi:uncharacterized membrane-anchored protein YjiN (DUF445 family)